MISYSEAQLPEAVRLAGANAFIVSLDRDSGEQLVCGNVLDLRCLTDESASQYLQTQGWLPQDAARPLVMVEYEIWATSADWSPEDPENLVYRRDRIFAEADNLVNNELLTSGIGLNVIEYEHLDGLFGSLREVHFPDQSLEPLADAIKAAHEDGIIDHFLDGGDIPEGLTGRVHNLYRELLLIAQRKMREEEQRYISWEQLQAHRDEESALPISLRIFNLSGMRRQSTAHTDAGSNNTSGPFALEVPSKFNSCFLNIKAEPVSGESSDWRVKAAIVRESRGGTFFRYAEAEAEFVIGPFRSSDEIRRELGAQVEDGRLLSRFGVDNP